MHAAQDACLPGRQSVGSDDHAATATTSGTVARGSTGRTRRPGVSAVAAVGGDGQAVHRPGVGADDNAATRAPATAAVVVRRDAHPAIGGDGSGAGKRTGPDHHRSAACPTRGCEPGRVVAAAGATTTAKDHFGGQRRKGRAAKAADGLVGVPAVATHAALASVGAAASSRVLVIRDRIGVRAATAGVARRAARRIATRVPVRGAADRSVCDRVVQKVRGAGDAFRLVTVVPLLARNDIVGAGAAGRPGLNDPEATLEAQLVDAYRLAVEVESASDVDGEDSARMRGPIPSDRGQPGGDGGARVLRNPDHLEGPEAVGRGDRGGEVVAVDETISSSGSCDGHAACGNGAGRGDVLVQTG